MKKLSICVIAISCICSLNGMELWNSRSSESSQSEEDNDLVPKTVPQNPRKELINAIVADNETGVVLALIKGAELNTPGKRYGIDDPPLCVAAGLGLRTVCESLIANGAEPDVPDGNGDTALHCAVRFGHLQAAKVLLQAGAYIESKNMWGQTVLHEALDVTPLNYKIIEWLLKKGAQVNTQDDDGNSPAHYAHMHDRDDVLDLLESHDEINWELKNEDGDKPSDMPLLAYYIRPPSPPPPPALEQRTISYADIDELLGYFFDDKHPAPKELTLTCLPRLHELGSDENERPIAVSSDEDNNDHDNIRYTAQEEIKDTEKQKKSTQQQSEESARFFRNLFIEVKSEEDEEEESSDFWDSE